MMWTSRMYMRRWMRRRVRGSPASPAPPPRLTIRPMLRRRSASTNSYGAHARAHSGPHVPWTLQAERAGVLLSSPRPPRRARCRARRQRRPRSRPQRQREPHHRRPRREPPRAAAPARRTLWRGLPTRWRRRGRLRRHRRRMLLRRLRSRGRLRRLRGRRRMMTWRRRRRLKRRRLLVHATQSKGGRARPRLVVVAGPQLRIPSRR